MLELVSILYFLALGLFLIAMRRHLLLNPAVVWVVAQGLMFAGTVGLLNLEKEPDQVHLVAMLVGLLLFMLGVALANYGGRRVLAGAGVWWRRPEMPVEAGPRFDFLVWSIVLVGLLVSLAYLLAVGYSVLVEGLEALWSGEGPLEDVSTLRLETYAGARYFAPGYVNQFKNVLVPALVGFLIVRTLLRRRASPRWLLTLGALSLATLFFLMMTGQRFPVMVALLNLVLIVWSVFRGRIARRLALWIGAASLLIFLALSLILGRSGVWQVGSWEDLGVLASELMHRFFVANQNAGVYGFRYVYELPTQYGAEWLSVLASVLPGKGEMTISSEIFHLFSGSFRGTSPLSLWGSIWYNFGVVGIIVVPFVLGAAYQAVYLQLVRGERTLFRVTLFAWISVVLGSWVAGGPNYLLNSGLLALLVLGLLKRLWTLKTGQKGVQVIALPRKQIPAAKGVA